MCFSPFASLSTFIIGTIGSLLCLTLGTSTDKLVGLFFGFVSSMQGIEFVLWKNQECNTVNKLFSLLGMIVNHLQPIILCLLILVLNNNLTHNKKQIIISLTIIYSIIITAYSMQFINDNMCTLKNEYNHLSWNWNSMKYKEIVYVFYLFMLIFLFYIGTPDKKDGIIISGIIFISYIISYFIYKDKKIIGTLWCLFAVFTSILWFGYKKLFPQIK
jgi:hypothetical protein